MGPYSVLSDWKYHSAGSFFGSARIVRQCLATAGPTTPVTTTLDSFLYWSWAPSIFTFTDLDSSRNPWHSSRQTPSEAEQWAWSSVTRPKAWRAPTAPAWASDRT